MNDTTIDTEDVKRAVEQGDAQILGILYNRQWKTVENWYRDAFTEALPIISDGWSKEERGDVLKLYTAIQSPATDQEVERKNRFERAILDTLNEKSEQAIYGLAFTKTTVKDYGIAKEIMAKLEAQQVAKADLQVAHGEAAAQSVRADGMALEIRKKLDAEGAGQQALIEQIAAGLGPDLSPADRARAVQFIIEQRGKVAQAQEFARNLTVSAVFAPGGSNSPATPSAGAMDLYALNQMQQGAAPGAVPNQVPTRQGAVPPSSPLPPSTPKTGV